MSRQVDEVTLVIKAVRRRETEARWSSPSIVPTWARARQALEDIGFGVELITGHAVDVTPVPPSIETRSCGCP